VSDAAVRTRLPLLAGAGVFGITYGLTSPLFALELTRRGYSEFTVGLNASMQALGVLTVALWLPGITQALGMRRVLLFALLAVALVLCAFPLFAWVWLWFPLRYALGIGSEGVMVTTETWASQLSSEATRATSMATYTAVVSIGMALGPLLLGHIGSGDAIPFLLAAALAVIASGLVMRMRARATTTDADTSERTLPGGLRVLVRQVPIALAATALNAALETAGLSFLPLYAMRLGWSEQGATSLISTLLVGAIVLQLPIGWLGDRVDRRRLVILLGALSAIGALAWPAAITVPWLAYVLLFVWGGAFVGIYTLMVTIVGSRYRGGDLVAVYAGMSLAFGVGALLGPAIAGVAMTSFRHGLPLFAAVACAVFTAYAWGSRARS